MRDAFDREINYMRISVTDRCNLRCRYCMPHGIQTVPMEQVLTYEEFAQVAQAAGDCGITRFKVTGGESLVRLGVEAFIKMLKDLPGTQEVTLTTNGILLSEKLPSLLDAGLDAVNISLDTTDAERYRQITGFDALPVVQQAIEAACDAGIKVKINAVPLAGVNEEDWIPLAMFARDRALDVRFIELMPIGQGASFPTVGNDTVAERLREHFGLMQADDSVHGNGPAHYVHIDGFLGSIGFISAIHGKFCSSCNRIRLTARGELKSCLCYENGLDLKMLLRSIPAEERMEHLRHAVMTAVRQKPWAHCFEDMSRITEKRAMASIGG